MDDITLTPEFSATYIPDYADESSFVRVNTSTLTDVPSAGLGGYGTHARLVYIVGGNSTLSGELTGLIGGGGGPPDTETIDNSPQRITSINTVTTGGTLAAGSQKHIFIFSADFTGSILGSIFDGSVDTSLVLEAPETDFLSAVPYTVASGDIRIVSFSGLAGTTGIPTVQRDPAIATVTLGGTVSSGARRATIIFSADYNGTVLGAAFSGATDTAVTFDAPSDDTLAAINYTIITGFLRLVVVSGGTATAESAIRTPTITDVTTSGTIAADSRRVDLIFGPSFVGTVLSSAFNGSEATSLSFAAPYPDTLAAIDYTISAGTLRIISLSGGATSSASSIRTPFISTANTSGSIAAGVRRVTAIFSTDFIGTILGTDFVGLNDVSMTFDAPDGDTLSAIPYTIDAGTMRIITVSGGTTSSTSVQRVPSISSIVSSGTIEAGSRKLTIVFSNDFTGTILGASFEGFTDPALILDAPSGSVLYSIPYSILTGSIRIISVAGGSSTTAITRSANISLVNQSGTIPAGARKLTLQFSSNFVGTVLESPFYGSVDTELNLDPPAGEILGSVPFTVDVGTIRIIKVQ